MGSCNLVIFKGQCDVDCVNEPTVLLYGTASGKARAGLDDSYCSLFSPSKCLVVKLMKCVLPQALQIMGSYRMHPVKAALRG